MICKAKFVQISIILLNIHRLLENDFSFCKITLYICNLLPKCFMRYFVLFTFIFCCFGHSINAKVIYGVYIPDAVIEQNSKDSIHTELMQSPFLINSQHTISMVETPHEFKNKNIEFLLALSLVGFVGVFRQRNSMYFRNLWRAFGSASLSKRQLKEQLEQDKLARILLDLFFCISGAIYIYVVLNYFTKHHWIDLQIKPIFILFLFLFLIIVYSGRYLFLKLAGWLFEIPDVMEGFSFQIFMMNKIMGLLLIPFSIILAFGHGPWVQISLLLSFVLIAFLFLYRYLRSRTVFGYFLKISRVHFFMYLCSSEILPWLIFIKVISVWLYLK